MLTYYGYPKCGTCRKAKQFLEMNAIPFTEINIAEQPPTAEELSSFIEMSGLEMKKFFNTSGMKYRELQLKDKLPNLSRDEQIALLASDGMLIKRPIIVGNGKVTVGFHEEQYENTWK